MSDIVERLRASARFLDELEDYPELQTEAADEITRLREENAQLQAQREKDQRLNHETESGLLEENVRLREENARLLGLLREAHVKMDANNLWSNLRHRVAAAIREGGKE